MGGYVAKQEKRESKDWGDKIEKTGNSRGDKTPFKSG